jgi:hypothetical protein
MDMSKILSEIINVDVKKGIMPIYFDETALNWYFADRKPLMLHPGYAYPEGWNLPFERMITQIDKTKHINGLFASKGLE